MAKTAAPKNVTCYVSRAEYRAIEAAGRKEARPVNEFARKVILDALNRAGGPVTPGIPATPNKFGRNRATVSMWFQADAYAALNRLAKSDLRTMSFMVRWLVLEYLERSGKLQVESDKTGVEPEAVTA